MGGRFHWPNMLRSEHDLYEEPQCGQSTWKTCICSVRFEKISAIVPVNRRVELSSSFIGIVRKSWYVRGGS